MNYHKRAADAALSDLLAAMGGVLLQGPRGCGKSTTALRQAGSSVRLDADPSLRELANLDPRALLEGATPRLIDEWQLAPGLWNVMRHEIDARREPGQFIVSGSASPAPDRARHSGAGRIGRLRMRTMSLSEFGRSADLFSFEDLISSSTISGRSPMGYRDMAEAAVIGGWPALLTANQQQARNFTRSYLDDLCSTEIPLATGVRHNPVRLRRLIEAVARNTATDVTIRRLAHDVSADGGELDPKTVRFYLDALAMVFAIDELPAWSVPLRSKSRLHTSSKLSMTDPSLACAALGIDADRLAKDPEFFGQIFESLVVRDVRAAIDARFGHAYHYRDNVGLEVDIIIEFEDGGWAAIEIKLGSAKFAEAERNLLLLRDKRVDLDRVGQPAFLAIFTATEYAYTLPSGIHIVPLATLRV